MPQIQALNSQQIRSIGSRLRATGILMAEAAIATVVLSVFVSTSPNPLQTQATASQPTAHRSQQPAFVVSYK